MRLSYEQLEFLKERFKVDTIYSYSRVNSYLTEPWIYRMTYLEKVGYGDSVYGYLGNALHDVIQDFYDNKYGYEELVNKFNESIMKWRTEKPELKFINKNVEDNYINSLHNYFTTTEVVPYDIKNETAICVHIPMEEGQDIVFIGYVDSEYVDDEGVLNIVDYKTSSISGFGGKQLKEKARQLTLYAIGINQTRGIPFEKIRLRFDMMKYYEIQFMQKNGKLGKTKAERSKWVEKIAKKLQKDLFELDYDPMEVDEVLEMSILNNNLDNLPKEVRDKYVLRNLYIDVTVTEDEAEEVKQLMKNTVVEIREKEKEDWETAFPEPLIDGGNRFFFEQLNSHLLKHHKRYQEEQSMIKATSDTPDEDLLSLFN